MIDVVSPPCALFCAITYPEPPMDSAPVVFLSNSLASNTASSLKSSNFTLAVEMLAAMLQQVPVTLLPHHLME